MGALKDEMEEKEQAWNAKASYEGWKCSRCGAIPPLSERDVYFETKMCGYCAHVTSKDD